MTSIALGSVRSGNRTAKVGATTPVQDIDFRNAHRIKGAMIAIGATSALWATLIGGASFVISLF